MNNNRHPPPSIAAVSQQTHQQRITQHPSLLLQATACRVNERCKDGTGNNSNKTTGAMKGMMIGTTIMMGTMVTMGTTTTGIGMTKMGM
jgi:hypothetical protein